MRRCILTLALCGLLPSCSLLGLDGFAVLSCESGLDCEPINDRDGIAPTSCERWVCEPSAGVCVLGTRDDDGDLEPPPTCGGMDCDDADPRRSSRPGEVCDGIDNDCNLAIDDLDLSRDAPASLVEAQDVVAVIAGSSGASYGASGRAHAVVALSASGKTTDRAALVELDGASAGTPADLEHGSPRTDEFGDTEIVDGCPIVGMADRSECNEAEAAISGTGSSWLVATVGTDVCDGAGELRIGTLRADANRIAYQGPDERSHIWYGVGTTTEAPRCTTNPNTVRGARAPALSAVASGEALAAYLADAPGASCVSDAEVEVEALGLWLEQVPGIAWVEATGSGDPTPMGTTRSLGGPSLAAWPGEGWLLAFGDAAGGVALRFATLPTAPPPPVDGVNHETAPLPRIDLPTVGSASVEHVAIALGRVDGRTAELGIAYQRGCDDASVWLVRVAVDLDGLTATSLGEPIELGAGEEPAIAHVESGMRVDADRAGGFVVLFVGPTGMRAARIADATGALVGDVVIVGEGTRSPSLYPGVGAGQLRYAYENGDELIGGALFCPPMSL